MRLIKLLDKLIGFIAVYCLVPLITSRPNSSIQSLLLIRPGGIGDAILLIPAIHALKSMFPQARIDILAEKRNVEAFTFSPYVDHVYCYDKNGELFSTIHARYDAVIDTEQWHRLSAVVARLTGAPLLIGFGSNNRKKLFTNSIVYYHDEYEARSFFKLLSPFNIPSPEDVLTPFLTIPPGLATKTEELLGSMAKKPFVAIFTGASTAKRKLGTAKFKKMVSSLCTKGIPVVIVGGKSEAIEGEIIISGSSGVNLAGKTCLVETAAVIDKSTVLLSGDSGILHIGVGLGKPTISLFGPGIAKKWAPCGDRHIVINKNLPCSPCTKFGYTPKCPVNAKCMADITVDEVIAAVEKLLAKQKDRITKQFT